MFKCKSIVVLVVLFVAISVLISACGSKNVRKSEVPDWYLNPPDSKEKIYGTGASEKTQSIELGKQVADSNARTALGNTIQVSIQGMVRTFLQQSGTLEQARALQFSEAVSKQVVNVTLSGIVISKREIKDGAFYSLAEISMDSVKNSLLSAIKDAAAEFSEAKAKQSFDDLSKEVQNGNIPITKP